MMQILATMESFVLAAGTDYFDWAIILFFIASAIISTIGNMIKKKRGELDDDEEEDGPVIILKDDFGQPASPPVARRARPPVVIDVADQTPTRRPVPLRPAKPSRSSRPQPPRPAPRRPVSRPQPTRRQPTRPRQAPERIGRPKRRTVGTLVDRHAATEHAKHIIEDAEAVGDHADNVGELDRLSADAPSRQQTGIQLDVSRESLRKAIVLNEILGPPLALREVGDWPGLG